MTGRFEWHITCPKEHATAVKKIADDLGFVFSVITGCPILGQGEYCYITGYNTKSAAALANINMVVGCLRLESVPTLRSKIEDIVYDSKTGVDRMTRECPDCSMTNTDDYCARHRQ